MATGATACSCSTMTLGLSSTTSTSSASPPARSWFSPGTTGPRTICSAAAPQVFSTALTSARPRAGIRTPCLVRWPGHITPGGETGEMVHVTDVFTTLLGWAGCQIPDDRVIDGIDQGALLLGRQQASARDGCLVWLNDELHAVKWGNFKVSFKRQQYFHAPELPLGFARIVNLLEDPKEREPVNQTYVRWWVMQHARRLVRQFEQSVEREALVPAGAPLSFVPARGQEPGGTTSALTYISGR